MSITPIEFNPPSKVLLPLYKKWIESPIGPLTLTANDEALVGLTWGQGPDEKRVFTDHWILKETEAQLKQYFCGERSRFELPLGPRGTDFQKKAWAELCKIPWGQIISYGEQARRLGQPKAVRAVGGANGKNPIGIIIPCHRVLGANGALTGFAGGIEIKKYLLELEGHREEKILTSHH